jgi:hypothetical protein
MVRQDHAEVLQSFLFAEQIAKAWRVTQADGDDKVVGSASRNYPMNKFGYDSPFSPIRQ